MAILGGPNQNVRIGAKMRNNFLNEGFPKGGVSNKSKILPTVIQSLTKSMKYNWYL